ncbi:hypothetical protein [Verrucomicrobium sp. BvORR106]|uniref:hypothetical protein n=1 Tax=Verrucomicrobium sp. BvORR106 TaxID=1403819 RepID=UPI0005705056|nr:hypothetical protein [Verrucomicrobium sp. BvORR106]
MPPSSTLRLAWSALAALAPLMAGAQSPVQPTPFESPPVLDAGTILQPQYVQGPYHTVRPQVPTFAGRNAYTLDSEFGTFYATGNSELVIRIAEINAIAQLQTISKSDEYAKALEKAAKSPVNFAKNLATHPVETISGVPKGIFKFINRTGQAVKEATEDRPHSPYEDSKVQGAIGFSKAKRDLASRLGVDPYSANPVFQKALNGVAWASYGGNMTLTAALAPVGGGAGTAITTVQVSDTAINAIRDSSPNDLRRAHAETLARIGIPDALATAFLNNPSYSPTRQAELVLALQQLNGVAGRDGFLDAATTADDEANAFFYQRSAHLMAQIHSGTPLATIYTSQDLPVCHAKDGTVIVPLEWDYASWTQNAANFLEHLRTANFRGAPVTGHRLVITGVASPRVREELARQQVALVEKALPSPLR